MIREPNETIYVNVLGKPWNANKCTAYIFPDRVIQIKYCFDFTEWFRLKTVKCEHSSLILYNKAGVN